MSTTANLGLTLPAGTDWADIAVLNANFELIDAAMGAARAAEAYSTTKTYAVGDYCTRDGALFKCTVAITAPETWTAGHWKSTSVAAELLAIIASLSSKMPLNGGTFYGRVNWFDENRSIGNGATPNQLDIVCGRASIRFDPDNIASGLSQCVLLRDTGSGTAYAIATATPPTEYDLPLASGITATEGGCFYSKTQDGIVNLVVSCKKETDGLVSDSIIATLPVDVRPAREAVTNAFAITSDNTTYGCSIRIWPSGEIKIWVPVTNVNQVGFQISFVAGN
ncbi:hypothetical protein [Oscillibacter ruminantium]|uniref:hypothetical protein n=1 Tax=Oscillibacter ruminantium TaxID=1263547 RepID=UPI00058D30EB|nr:hypothetical protein [Oscillibacter ruminantium]